MAWPMMSLAPMVVYHTLLPAHAVTAVNPRCTGRACPQTCQHSQLIRSSSCPTCQARQNLCTGCEGPSCVVISPAGPRDLPSWKGPLHSPAKRPRMTREAAGVLTHLGLEPLRELGPEPVKLQAHFSVHTNAHVVVHHLCLHLHNTGMSAGATG
jgi:hypothetical protein